MVIADDNEPMQRYLCRLLEPYHDIVAVAPDGVAALVAIEEFRPTLVLLDIRMPMMNGVAVLKQLKKASPGVKVIFVSGHSKKIYMDEAFRLGADGYVFKHSIESELVTAVEIVLSGGIYSPP